MDRASRTFLLCAFLLCLVLGGPLQSVRAEEEEGYAGDPEEAAEVFDEAEALRETGQWDKAATRYWDAVEADLRHFRAHVRYQEAALRAGDPKDELIKDYKSFVEEYPKLFALKLHLLRLTHEPAERVAALEALAKENKEDWNVGVELGRALLASGDPAKAAKVLAPAQDACPASRTDVLLLLSDAEYSLGKPVESRKRLEAAVKANAELFDVLLALARLDLVEARYMDAAKRAREVLELRPGHIGAFLIQAEAQYRSDDVAGALATLVSARRAAPENRGVKLAYADVLAKEEEGRAAAIKLYSEVTEADEENIHGFYGWGWALERQGKFEEAEAKYREVVAIEPDSVVAANSVGYCLYLQGRITDAQVQFKKAMDLDPEYGPAVLNLGATYDAQAKYAEAIKIYEGFLKDNPKNLRALVNCAFDYESINSFPKALKLLLEAHEVQPNDPLIVTWVGDNNYFQERWKDAEKWYTKAVDLDAESFFAWRGLGYALGHMKRWDDAVKALEKAQKLDEKDLDVYLALGDIYMQELENLEAALKAFQGYVQRGGTDPAIQDVIIEIQKQLDK